MKLITNDTLIKRNKKIGNILSFLGIAILASGLVLNLKHTPQKTLISFGALIVGFIIAQISTYYVTKFGRSPRFDELINDNLSRLNNNYAFFVYSSPVPMLLTGPYGIWIPIPVAASGEIVYDKKWKQHGGGFLLKLFGQENIGRPQMDADSNVKVLQDFLEKHFSAEEMPTIKPILVSLHPKAVIGDVENAPLPIVQLDGLRRYIRKIDRKVEEQLSAETLEKLNQLLGG
jgi:hypothetical protein